MLMSEVDSGSDLKKLSRAKLEKKKKNTKIIFYDFLFFIVKNLKRARTLNPSVL